MDHGRRSSTARRLGDRYGRADLRRRRLRLRNVNRSFLDMTKGLVFSAEHAFRIPGAMSCIQKNSTQRSDLGTLRKRIFAHGCVDSALQLPTDIPANGIPVIKVRTKGNHLIISSNSSHSLFQLKPEIDGSFTWEGNAEIIDNRIWIGVIMSKHTPQDVMRSARDFMLRKIK